jgi:hypothetical protein
MADGLLSGACPIMDPKSKRPDIEADNVTRRGAEAAGPAMLTDQDIEIIASGFVLTEYERLGIKETPDYFQDEVRRETDRLKRAISILRATGYDITRR